MGTGSKVASVLFRVGELVCAAIVLGILSRFIRVVNLGNGSVESKLIYTEVWAAMSIAFSILLCIPAMYSFYLFPLDLIMFIGWMVAFGLDYNLTGGGACTSWWYWNYWGYYWGRFWYIPRSSITAAAVGSEGCSEWRALLAFAFIGGFCWLANMLIGIYVVARRQDEKRDQHNRMASTSTSRSDHWWKKEKAQAPPSPEQQTVLTA